MLIGMQQQNFKVIMENMLHIDGWEIIERQGLLALKSLVDTPLINMVWGEVTQNNYQTVIEFYRNKPFYWLLNEYELKTIPDELKHLFIIQDELSKFPEMYYDLQNGDYTLDQFDNNINIIIPHNTQLDIWTKTAIATLTIPKNDWESFFYPLIEHANCIPLLVYYNDTPIGTSMIYCDKESSISGIYAMSTLQEFRRKKIASHLLYKCFDIAKESNSNLAVLYASELGEKLYQNIGFKTSQILYEFGFNQDL